MKKLLSRLLLLFPFLLLIILVNLTGDAARLFKSKDYERKMADALIAGSAITDLRNINFDDRAWAKFMIQSLKAREDIGIFGSSRTMEMSSEMFPGKTVLNSSLVSASLEDFISLYEIYKEKKVLPSTIIIDVDPWIFNKNSGSVAWKRFDPRYYSKFTNLNSRKLSDLKIRPQDLMPYEFQQLVSLSYFQTNIQFLWSLHFRLASNQQGFSLTSQKWNEGLTILPDGSRTRPKSQREVTLAEVKKHIREDTYQAQKIIGFFELDQGLKQEFIKLIESMKNDGVKVILFLSPYHPFAYDYYMHTDQYKIINDVEIFVRNTSATYGLTLIGSYNPHQLSIPESSFIDELHLKGDTELKKIFPVL